MSKSSVMTGYIPELLRSSLIFSTILSVEGTEMDEVIASQQKVLKQFYVETADGRGLDRWEEMLGLSGYAAQPLDQRRSRIIAKLRGMGTVTVPLIKNVAESYIYGKVAVIEHPDQYSFTVKFVDSRGVPSSISDVKAAIEKAKPAHLAVEYEFTFTTWREVKALSWGQVKTGTWDQLRSREIA